MEPDAEFLIQSIKARLMDDLESEREKVCSRVISDREYVTSVGYMGGIRHAITLIEQVAHRLSQEKEYES